MNKLLCLLVLPLCLTVSCSDNKGNVKEALAWVNKHYTTPAYKYYKEVKTVWNFSNSTGPLAFSVIKSIVDYFGVDIGIQDGFQNMHITSFENEEKGENNMTNDIFVITYCSPFNKNMRREYKFNDSFLTAYSRIIVNDEKVECNGVYTDIYDEKGFTKKLECDYDHMYLYDGSYVSGHLEQTYLFYE